jgi:hypothetical protein
MPIKLQIIRASEFVRLGTDELLDLEASKRVLEGLAAACRIRGLDRAVLDIRDVPIPSKPQFTTDELAALVRTFQQAGLSPGLRLAVLYHHDIYGGVRKFAFFSRLRGIQVRAFHDFETALQWLSEGREDDADSPGVPVPIKQSKTKIRPAAAATDFPAKPAIRPARGATKGKT